MIKSPFNGLHQPIGPRPLHLTNFPRRKISTLLATSLFVFNTFTLSACGGGPRDGNIHNRGNLQGTVVQEGPVNKDNPGGIIIINKGPGKTEIWEYPAYDNNELDNDGDEGGVIIVGPAP